MLDKYKILRKAEKLVIEQKFSQAIQEYEKLLQKDGDDPSLLNTIGDLMVRTRKTSKALEYFHKVAQIYLNSGFALRAIATYKKIHRLDPSDLNVNQQLAELFQKQGLNQDACRHLEILVRHHKDTGNLDEALVWMNKAVDLDPENSSAQLQLAQTLADKGDRSSATAHYVKAIELLLQKKQYERVIKAARQALQTTEHDPKLGEAHAEAADHLSQLDEAEEFLNQGLEDGPYLPFQFALALVAERKGEITRASRLLQELIDKGHKDAGITEVQKRLRAADFLERQPEPDQPREEGDEAEQEEQAAFEPQEFDFGGQEWGEKEQEQTLSENPFHPAGTVEEVELDEESAFGNASGSGSGLFLEEEETPADSGKEEGLFGTASGEDLFQVETALAGEEESALEHETPLEAAEEEPPQSEEDEEGLDDYAVASLEEALEEADFYLKLGFQEEATRVLKVLLRDYPGDERVQRRAKKVPGLVPAPARAKPDAKPGEKVVQFDREIDAALDVLFEGEDEEELPADEVLRYDVQKSGEPRGENPKVHYDLGLAYKEMGLVEDAIQEFLSAVKLFKGDEHQPQRILCCSTLANSYLQLDRYDDAIHWARQGLQIEDMKDFEWKALQYDLGRALECKGESDTALETFRKIANRDKNYRDVPQRIEQLTTH